MSQAPEIIVIPDIDVPSKPRRPQPAPDINIPPLSPIDEFPSGSRGGAGRGSDIPGGGFSTSRLPPHRRINDPNAAPPPRVHHPNHSHKKHPELKKDKQNNRHSPTEQVNDIWKSIIENKEFLGSLSDKQITLLAGMGLAFMPEAAASALSYGATVLTLGPIGEAATLEILSNEAFVHAATRAGALTGGKLLNLEGIFKTERFPINKDGRRARNALTPDQMVSGAIHKSVKTERDELIFWSGLSDGIVLSKEFAIANGGKTLEMTPGGAWLHALDLFGPNSPVTRDEARTIWRKVSLQAAKEASGQVRSVIGRVSPDSVYHLEKNEILSNPNVLGLDELRIEPIISIKLRGSA